MVRSLLAPRDLIRRLRSPEGQKLVKYSVASAVAVVISEICLVMFNGVIGMSAWVSSSLATAIAAFPNYYMNRKWAWGKTGRSHMLKEVVPFWALAVLGWAVSTFSVYLMEHYDQRHGVSHLLTTASVAVVYIGAFGVLWVAKFVIFNKLMFVHRHHHDDHADGDQGGTVSGPAHLEAVKETAAIPNGAVRTGEPAGIPVNG